MNRILLPLLTFALAACTAQNPQVRVTAEQPPAQPAPKAVLQTRNEPIFYNGKTYQLRFAPGAAGAYAMSVAGMGSNQSKDATAVATSSLRYFACKEGMTGKLTSAPRYDGKVWHMTVRCA